MPKIFGMNIRSLLFMPGHLDLQTDPISGIPKACPHSRNTSRRGSSKNDERSRRGPKGSFSSARTSSRIGSMLRRLSSSTKGSRYVLFFRFSLLQVRLKWCYEERIMMLRLPADTSRVAYKKCSSPSSSSPWVSSTILTRTQTHIFPNAIRNTITTRRIIPSLLAP